MTEVYLLLGANHGNPAQNLGKARLLIAERCGAVLVQSSLYQTQAWGVKQQAPFLNQAIQINTVLSPAGLLAALKAIEKEMGRVETTKWGPRVIDIDILFYGNEVVDMPVLKIPHPFIPERRFTLAPMNEIAPALLHPLLQKTISELLADCKDDSEIDRM